MASFAQPSWSISPEYKKLSEDIAARGLLDRMPFHYAAMFGLLVMIFAVFFFSLQFVHGTIAVIGLALLMSFPRAWWGYFGHDISHGEVFSSQKAARIGTLLVWPLSLGLSGTYWYQKHNQHHEFVNKIGSDPDLSLPVFFSDKQRSNPNTLQRLIPRWIMKYQHLYFFFLFPLLSVTFYIETLKTLLFPPYSRYKFIELFLVIAHFVLFYGAIFWLLGFQNGMIFSVINGAATGAMMAMAFAPNHKGQEMFDAGEELTWKHQVIASRNLTPSLVVDFLYGGLNYQIEHHLFPMMPRFNLKRARPVIKKFCADNGVPYYETTPFDSMKEIYLSLKNQVR
jgi:fatty acid desaturase